MEDRFKFRAYLKDENIIIDDFFICPDRNSIIKNEFCVDFTSLPAEYKLEDIILMQCTGLKDKNGKLIYEGDKLKPDEVNSIYEEVVVWDDDDAMFKVRGLYSDEEWNGLYSESVEEYVYEPLRDYRDIEIIGNIYENPELLEAN